MRMSLPISPRTFERVDRPATRWMARNGIFALRVSLGIVFLWFGALKFIPGLSAADELATKTIATLTGGLVQPNVSRVVLAAWESAIGIGLLSGRWTRATILLLVVQMLGTVTPLVLFMAETWRVPFLVPTLEGQYIIKNMVLVSAALVIGATVRGGGLSDEPLLARERNAV
jgi:uncharacterized membrane protein YphA (DoxX/SURF4 family)